MRSRFCPCVCRCIPLSLLGNGSVKVPLSLLGNGYVFYAVRVVSKESRRLVLPITSFFFLPFMSAETLNAKIASFLTRILSAYLVSFCIQVELVNVELALFEPRILLFLILDCLGRGSTTSRHFSNSLYVKM
jgi:hypothetical protein